MGRLDGPVAELDYFDEQILSRLYKDGRRGPTEIGKEIGLAERSVRHRLELLEGTGIINSYVADIDPRGAGWKSIFYVMVGLESQKATILSDFENLVGSWIETRECHMIRGGNDFLLKMFAHDEKHRDEIIKRLNNIPILNRLQVLDVLRGFKVFGAPLPES